MPMASRANDQRVTRREAEVWRLVGEHLTNAEIAAQLCAAIADIERYSLPT